MRGEDENNASLFTSVRLENFVLSEHMLLQVL
ncbi:hypothetical protein PD5205_01308 [Xanthomonas fragariae]|uniref:Uncharacterized protein n=1 Tax=Xanthomonas fragariae TaxID=48664 RepID=A0A1Y6H8U5_9XANT|nr:hypothetical protein PD885_02698 [Xanthomonas fragariae]SMR02619.1 hypothetical protein PD5205_01308 [Xanthomonas fragariae]